MTTLDERLATLQLIAERKRYNALAFFAPYPKQIEFISLTARKRQAALIAGNRVGKSEVGAFITSTHLTGRYPPWWPGRRFDPKKKGLRVWVSGPSGQSVRDTVQNKLLGPPGIDDALGSGFIPRETIVGKPSTSRSATDAVDTVHVKHVNGSTSALTFKTYEQDRRHWQGEGVDFIWFDEEPTEELYGEGLARTFDTKGSVICTFTPLEGFDAVVSLYLYGADGSQSAERDYVRMAVTDAPHLGPRAIEEAKETYPNKIEWEARIYGNPVPGTGRVYTAEQGQIEWDVPAEIPDEWLKIWGIDFGIDHPFAAALCAWDRDDDAFYVLNGFKISDELVLQHTTRMREIAGNIPVAWPHDGHARADRTGGQTLSTLYRNRGLLMIDEHAKMENGSNSIYASTTAMNEWMRAGRFRVARHLTDWFKEYVTYHYKDGKIVPKADDLLSATRYAWMMRRRAKAGPLTPGMKKRPKWNPIREFDVFTGKPVRRD